MEVITVNELLALCEEQKAQGNGDKKIYISSDDEGNDFHALFYSFTSDPKKIKKATQYSAFVPRVKKNIVLLG